MTGMVRTFEDGTTVCYTAPPFSSILKIKNCLCEDDNRRTIQITGEPGSPFHLPGRTKVNGKTVTGIVNIYDGDAIDGICFYADRYRKNYREIKSHRVKIYELLENGAIEIVRDIIKDYDPERSSDLVVKAALNILDIPKYRIISYFHEWLEGL